jgi:hypothetical protein
MKWWFRQQLYTQIAICIGIGIALGLLLGLKMMDAAVFNDGRTLDSQSTAAAVPPRPSPDDGKPKQ